MSAPPSPDAPAAPVAIALQLLGMAQWQVAGGPAQRLTAKDAALLAKLALDGPQPRAVLWALLWPEAGAEQAADSLRQRASRLRRAAGASLVAMGDPVHLGASVAVDIAALPQWPPEALLAAGPLLAGVDLGQQGDLDGWLAQARQRVTQTVVQALADHAERLEREGRLRDALPLARHIVALQPLDEHGQRRLMRLHYLRNDRAAAQATFWGLRALLRDELGILPSAETQQLMQTIEAAEVAAALPRRPVPASVHRPPLLVGRDSAWQAMGAAWQRPQPFVLVGEAGLGKTRLLEDFVHQQGGVLLDRAQPGDERAPYALLGRVLVAVDQRFAPVLGASVRTELARLRPEFGASPPSPAHAPVLWHAAAQLLAAGQAAGMQALVLDDLHNADTASLEALRWLGASPLLSALRLGLATRPGLPADSPLMAWLQDSYRPLHIVLQPLSPNDLTRLLASLALPALVDSAFSERLYRHAGGHPLYTLATLQDVISRGEPVGSAHLPRPLGVAALLDARLAALPPEALDLLRVAAVAGPELRADLAAQLLGRPVLALSDAWARLEADNVLQGEAFSHDLMHEAALRAVPKGVRQALHRQLAALLAGAPGTASPARLAWHWVQGERWAEAGRCWSAAALAAAQAGRLAEQISLYEQAAQCQAQAGDGLARAEALLARLDALQLRHGGSAALAALPEVEALAATAEQRLRCQLVRTAAWLDGEQGAQAAQEAAQAVHLARLQPAWLPLACALQAEALAQCGRHDEALAAATAALAAAQAAGLPGPMLRALDAVCYVRYASGQLLPAVAAVQAVLVQAQQLGWQAEAAAAEGNLAALLAATGDVPGSHAHALACRARHQAIGLSDNSTLGAVNHIVLGAAAATLGRFGEALAALQAAVAMAGPQAAPAAQAKARLGLANLWLRLGRPDLAFEAVAALPPDIVTGLRMQAELVRAEAALQSGRSPRRHWQLLARLGAEQPEPPLVQSAWFEWGAQGEPAVVIPRLVAAARHFAAQGLAGNARALQWRALTRWLDCPGDAATAQAHRLAQGLWPHALRGLSAKCHPPQTLWSLAQAFERAGDAAQQALCRDAAWRWLDEAGLQVPDAHRPGFLSGQPVHRAWLAQRPQALRPPAA